MGIVKIPTDGELLVLINTIRDVFGKWKIEQVEHAYDLGLDGSIDIDMQLYNKPFNTVFMSTLMRAYKKYIDPVILQSNNEIKQAPSSKQIALQMKNGAIQCFKRYLNNHEIIDYGNVNYEYLKLFINFTPDRDLVLKDEAKSLYLHHIEKKRDSTKYGPNRVKLNEIIQQIITNQIESKEQAGIDREYKNLALREYFDSLIKMEMDLTEILK